MSIKESEALVIKSYNLSEADRIVVFFTREYGIVRGVAKGAKRLQSRFGSTLEPFSTVNLTYFQKEERELVSIQQVELTQSRFAIASDPAFLATYSYIGDLLTEFSLPHDADKKLYRMISACLSAATGEDALAAIRLYFELWLLRLSGFLPDWNRCESCRGEIRFDEPSHLVAGFGLKCNNCRSGHTLTQVAPDEVRLFHSVQKLAPAAFVESTQGRDDALRTVSSLMKRLIAQALGREVATGAALR